MKTGFLILSFGIAGYAGAAALEESPINRIQNPQYICQFSSGDESLALRLPTWNQSSKLWLTMTGNDIGLDTVVESFSFLRNPGEYEIKGHYVFSGALNKYHVKTEPLVLNSLNQEDLPPGSEDPPPGSEPGDGDDSGNNQPPDQNFDGPELTIKYRELSADGKRIIFEADGNCVPAAKPLQRTKQFVWHSWAQYGRQKPLGN